MFKSPYYREASASKSNTLIAISITIAVLFLTVFLLFGGLATLGNACEGATVSGRMKDCISRYGYTFYDFKYLGKTSDEPKNSMHTIYKCSVKSLNGMTSFRNCYGLDAYVKVELGSSDVMDELSSIDVIMP